MRSPGTSQLGLTYHTLCSENGVRILALVPWDLPGGSIHDRQGQSSRTVIDFAPAVIGNPPSARSTVQSLCSQKSAGQDAALLIHWELFRRGYHSAVQRVFIAIAAATGRRVVAGSRAGRVDA